MDLKDKYRNITMSATKTLAQNAEAGDGEDESALGSDMKSKLPRQKGGEVPWTEEEKQA